MHATVKFGLTFAFLAAVASAAVANPREATGDTGPQRVQNRAGGDGAADFGNTSDSYSTVHSYGFIPDNNSMLYQHGFVHGGFYCRAGDTVRRASAQLHVPHGAQLRILSVWGGDSTANDIVQVRLRRTCLPDFAAGFPSTSTLGIVTTGTAFAAGDFYDFDNFAVSNEIADNQSCAYAIVVDFGACTADNQLGIYKARVSWRRTVPPAPVAATFADVPTSDAFFQVIEALVASGITVGCGGGNFCPEQPVTRAAMAAFLARALGLPRATISDPANP